MKKQRDPIMARLEIVIYVGAALVITYFIFGPTIFSLMWSLIK
jgi:hypothetical protein